MPAQNVRSIRIVAQHIYNDWRSSYRLVAYADRQCFRPLEFESLHDLLNALRSAMPDFDENSFLIRNDARDSYIVLAREVELNDSQFSTLGLKDGPKMLTSEVPRNVSECRGYGRLPGCRVGDRRMSNSPRTCPTS